MRKQVVATSSCCAASALAVVSTLGLVRDMALHMCRCGCRFLLRRTPRKCMQRCQTI